MRNSLTALAAAVLLGAAGCATGPLPRHAQLVGGGLEINWAPTQNGTAILYERKTSRVIATVSLEADQSFEFSAKSEENQEALNKLFGEGLPPNATFELYFVPAPKRPE